MMLILTLLSAIISTNYPAQATSGKLIISKPVISVPQTRLQFVSDFIYGGWELPPSLVLLRNVLSLWDGAILWEIKFWKESNHLEFNISCRGNKDEWGVEGGGGWGTLLTFPPLHHSTVLVFVAGWCFMGENCWWLGQVFTARSFYSNLAPLQGSASSCYRWWIVSRQSEQRRTD